MIAPVVLSAVTAVSVLQGAQLKRAQGVQFEQRIRDGVLADDGAEWNSDTAALLDAHGVVEWDLGKETPIAGALVQGDNNDDYVLSGSLDGQNFNLLWRAPPNPDPGLRTRTVVLQPPSTARYLRLTAEGGDNFYSVSELQVFSTTEEAQSVAQKAMKTVSRGAGPDAFNPMWLVLVAFTGAIVYFWVLKKKPEEDEEEKEKPAGN